MTATCRQATLQPLPLWRAPANLPVLPQGSATVTCRKSAGSPRVADLAVCTGVGRHNVNWGELWLHYTSWNVQISMCVLSCWKRKEKSQSLQLYFSVSSHAFYQFYNKKLWSWFESFFGLESASASAPAPLFFLLVLAS